MSIIRLSLLEDGLYAPDPRGSILYTGRFSRARGPGRRGLGRIGKIARRELPKPGHPLRQYLEKGLDAEDANVPDDPAGMPLVVLVHGFQFDPSKAYFSPPHHPKAENPHCRLYHFQEYDQDTEMPPPLDWVAAWSWDRGGRRRRQRARNRLWLGLRPQSSRLFAKAWAQSLRCGLSTGRGRRLVSGRGSRSDRQAPARASD